MDSAMFHTYCITDGRAYCDEDGVYKRAYKIGKAQDPVERTRNLRKQETFLDEKFKCEFVIKSNVTELEPMFHRKFSKYRVSGLREWFIAPLEKIIEYANELCEDDGNVILDYEALCVSDSSPNNMVKLIQNKLANTHIVLATDKTSKKHTKDYIHNRLIKIGEILANYKAQHGRDITVQEFQNMKITFHDKEGAEIIYKNSDFYYDIRCLYFQIVERKSVHPQPRMLANETTKPRRFFVSSYDEEETKEELYAWETKEDDCGCDGNNGFKSQ